MRSICHQDGNIYNATMPDNHLHTATQENFWFLIPVRVIVSTFGGCVVIYSYVCAHVCISLQPSNTAVGDRTHWLSSHSALELGVLAANFK